MFATHAEALQRGLQRFDNSRVVALPDSCSLTRVEELLETVRTFMTEVKAAAIKSTCTKLEASMNILDSIAYGSNDGETWFAAFYAAPSPETWKESVDTLHKVDTKKLDATVASCEAHLQAATLVSETFASAADFADLKVMAEKNSCRAKATKIEGTIMYILRAHADDAAAQRSKCEKQRRPIKKLEDKHPRLMHPKVKELLHAALKS